MKFETSNGKQYIILDNNEEVHITTSENLSKEIILKNTDSKLNITGKSELIESIHGSGMLEKVYVPPVVSKEEIIRKCDKWLEMFKNTHDRFKKISLKEYSKEENIGTVVSFGSFVSSYSEAGRTIDIDLKRFGTIIKEGMTITVNNSNKGIYEYLVANVLDYYLSKNYANAKIDFKNTNGRLYSKETYDSKDDCPIFAGISSLLDYDSYTISKIVTKILINHNLGESSKQIIDNLKNEIPDQRIDDKFEKGIEYSIRQYENIFPKKEEESVLKKTLK